MRVGLLQVSSGAIAEKQAPSTLMSDGAFSRPSDLGPIGSLWEPFLETAW